MAQPSELLRIGRLCPVKVYNPDAVGRRRCKGNKVKPVGDPIAHWLKYAKGQPTVVFAATVLDSQKIVQRYLDAGITAEHIDAQTSDEDRDEVFERSRTGATKIVSNCGVMILGVDLPWLACCQILRGCNSLVLYFQACGRVQRSFPGKPHGVILDHSGCAHEFGLPDADYEWVLGDERQNSLFNKPPRERKPITCLGCGLTFVGKPACPECGRVLSKKQRKSLAETINGDAVLTEFTGLQSAQAHADALDRLWKKCLYIARAKGGTLKMAAAMFRSSSKILPWDAGLEAALPQRDEWDTPVKDWLDSQTTFA
jgi:superfamily II DNA or RNA helicase